MLVGYEYETYDAQFLQSVGCELDTYFVDCKTYDPACFHKSIKGMNFKYVQCDLNDIDQYSEEWSSYFDYIFTSRACLDCFHYSKMLKAIKVLRGMLRDSDSAIISHVQSFFLTRKMCEGDTVNRNYKISYPAFSNRHLLLEPKDYYFHECRLVNHIKEFISLYQGSIKSKWIEQILKQSVTIEEKLKEISMSHTHDINRIFNLRQIHPNARMLGAYFSMAPSSVKGALYISNHICIPK